ncbi:hypothetical protein GCM10023080_081100 [Streptomyces pseudoechinosporeus]
MLVMRPAGPVERPGGRIAVGADLTKKEPSLILTSSGRHPSTDAPTLEGDIRANWNQRGTEMEWWIWLIIAVAIAVAAAASLVSLQARRRSGGVIAQGRRPRRGGGQRP